MFIPIAWRLLLLRSVSRKWPDAPAPLIVSNVQLQILRHRLSLDETPRTAKEAAYAVGKLAGHLKRNGDPGWLSLGQGLEILLIMEAGWRAALAAQRSDQSRGPGYPSAGLRPARCANPRAACKTVTEG